MSKIAKHVTVRMMGGKFPSPCGIADVPHEARSDGSGGWREPGVCVDCIHALALSSVEALGHRVLAANARREAIAFARGGE